jgi:hypothetical protein
MAFGFDDLEPEMDPLDLTSAHVEVLARLGRLEMPMTDPQLRAVGLTIERMRMMARMGWVTETQSSSRRGGEQRRSSKWRITDEGLAVVRVLVKQMRAVCQAWQLEQKKKGVIA